MELSLPAQGGHQIIAHRAVDFDGAEVAVKLEAFEGGDNVAGGHVLAEDFGLVPGNGDGEIIVGVVAHRGGLPLAAIDPRSILVKPAWGPRTSPSVPFFGAAAGRTGNDLENIVFSMLFCGHYDRPDPRPLWGVGRTLRSAVIFAVRSKLRWLRAPATTDNRRAESPSALLSFAWAKRASTARSPCSSARRRFPSGVRTMRSMRPRITSAASVTVSGALSASARRSILLR